MRQRGGGGGLEVEEEEGADALGNITLGWGVEWEAVQSESVLTHQAL